MTIQYNSFNHVLDNSQALKITAQVQIYTNDINDQEITLQNKEKHGQTCNMKSTEKKTKKQRKSKCKQHHRVSVRKLLLL
jgi:hypothetical protein